MYDDLLKLGSEALQKAALNEDAKAFILSNENLYRLFKKAARRYIGGETLEEALLCVEKIEDEGYAVTTDFMGESIRNEKEANDATRGFIRFAAAARSANLNSSVSLDLSHIGLLVSEDLVKENLAAICIEAGKANREVIISMEGTDRTDRILDIYKEILKTHKNLGITVQAYLHRTKNDLKELTGLSGSIRLVKGAYDAPKELSLGRGNELDNIYLDYVEQLLAKDHPCAIASHDPKMQEGTIKLIDRYKPTNYVLEKLLGICDSEFQRYISDGYKCRTYVVYGKEWYLYLCNRLAEYPLNLFQALADIISPSSPPASRG